MWAAVGQWIRSPWSGVAIKSTQGTRLWKTLGAVGRPATGFEQTLAHGQLRRVEAKELLFVEGDTISYVYRIETGALALYKVLADGRRQYRDDICERTFRQHRPQDEHSRKRQS